MAILSRSLVLAAAGLLGVVHHGAAQDLLFSQSPIGSLIVKYESGGRNIPNGRYDATHTAGGLCQMTNETWRQVAPTVDIDLVKFPNAGSASRFVQDQVCWKLLATDGVWPWTCCNKPLRDYLAQHPTPIKAQAPAPPQNKPRPIVAVTAQFLTPGPTPGVMTYALMTRGNNQ